MSNPPPEAEGAAPTGPPAEPRPAASVIVVRRGGGHGRDGVEALMLQRGTAARFMPGVWVFAGGVVDLEDFESAAADPTLGDPELAIDPDEAAHRICGARELEEEGGISIDPAGLLPWSRWITPVEVPVRFDTRFYVARAPAHAKPEPDGVEMDAARWISPGEALALGEGDDFPLSFPTVRHLETLVEFTTVDELIAGAAGRNVEPILPRVSGTREELQVLLPGDAGYDEAG